MKVAKTTIGVIAGISMLAGVLVLGLFSYTVISNRGKLSSLIEGHVENSSELLIEKHLWTNWLEPHLNLCKVSLKSEPRSDSNTQSDEDDTPKIQYLTDFVDDSSRFLGTTVDIFDVQTFAATLSDWYLSNPQEQLPMCAWERFFLHTDFVDYSQLESGSSSHSGDNGSNRDADLALAQLAVIASSRRDWNLVVALLLNDVARIISGKGMQNMRFELIRNVQWYATGVTKQIIRALLDNQYDEEAEEIDQLWQLIMKDYRVADLVIELMKDEEKFTQKMAYNMRFGAPNSELVDAMIVAVIRPELLMKDRFLGSGLVKLSQPRLRHHLTEFLATSVGYQLEKSPNTLDYLLQNAVQMERLEDVQVLISFLRFALNDKKVVVSHLPGLYKQMHDVVVREDVKDLIWEFVGEFVRLE